MEMRQLPRSVVRITLLHRDETGVTVARTIYRQRGRKRKVTVALRPIDKAARRLATSTSAWANSYVSRHERSNMKRKDGWLSELPSNMVKSVNTGAKQLKLDRPLFP